MCHEERFKRLIGLLAPYPKNRPLERSKATSNVIIISRDIAEQFLRVRTYTVFRTQDLGPGDFGVLGQTNLIPGQTMAATPPP